MFFDRGVGGENESLREGTEDGDGEKGGVYTTIFVQIPVL